MFKHHCPKEKCRFLGHYDGHDLYAHRHGSGRLTVKARHGDGLNDFLSWGGVMPPKEGHLLRAYKLAKERGLVLAGGH